MVQIARLPAVFAFQRAGGRRRRRGESLADLLNANYCAQCCTLHFTEDYGLLRKIMVHTQNLNIRYIESVGSTNAAVCCLSPKLKQSLFDSEFVLFMLI